MALTLVTVSGRVVLPNGVAPTSGVLKFKTTGWDAEGGDIIIPDLIEADIDGSGNVSISVWASQNGLNRVYYRVSVQHYTTSNGRVAETVLAREIAVPDVASIALADLLETVFIANDKVSALTEIQGIRVEILDAATRAEAASLLVGTDEIRLGPQDVEPANPALRDAFLRVNRTRDTEGDLASGSEQHGIVGFAKVQIAGTRTKATQTAGVMGVAEAWVDGDVYRADAVGVYGQGTIMDTAKGRAWGMFVSSATGYDDGTSDGEMYGIEVAVDNNGGTEQDVVDGAYAKTGIWAVGTKNTRVNPKANTAVLATALNTAGWFFGIALREVKQHFLHLSRPKDAGAVALTIVPHANWADSLILMPEGKGIATYDTAGTTSALMLTGEDDGTVAQFAMTARVRRSGVNALLIIDRSDTPVAAREFGSVQFRDRNVAGTAREFARVAGASQTITDGAEVGLMSLRVMQAGTLTDELRLANGVIIGNPTSNFRGAGTLNVQNGYYANGTAGASGTFTSADGKTITVSGGIITGIV